MPPKQKFTKEEIIGAALDLVRRDGMAAVTARALGEALGSSSRPIFTTFVNMEDVQREIMNEARKIYNGYVREGLTEEHPFQGVGKAYIRFAAQEPMLFHMLFMTANPAEPDLQNVLDCIDENSTRILEAIRQEYELTEEKALRLYQELWIFTHGIAALIATGVCRFSTEEIMGMMRDVLISVLQRIKEEDTLS
ncbi:TetR-like C-terminal domain-containing protein [Anaerolentibacter hominis]|uniref:TetR/AcrR family transcriptional regulator n=1 Tax=Anaerolentibacter hominis TaxID=3079009 RepID=UPI0031B888C8